MFFGIVQETIIMKKYLFLFAFAGFLWAACSSPVHVERDSSANLSSYKTYMWVETMDSANDGKARKTAFADISVHNAVNEELGKLGWAETSTNPDILVSYDILVERSINERTEPVYSQPMRRVYYNPYARRFGTIYYPSQFLGYQTYSEPIKEGTVTISLVDANTDKPVWQGWTTEDLSSSMITGEEIAGSIRNIFRKFNR
jgi:hypothetical protein